MKKLLFALLFLAACNRDKVVESTGSPADETTAATTTTAADTASTSAPAPPATASVSGPKLAFVDEASKDPSFATYRDQLLTAVRARDKKTVLSLSDPKIRTSFGGDGGTAALERALDEDLWKELEQILTLGGSFREGMFWAPYVYSAWPESADSFETFAIVADDVPLRETADANATTIATLSRDLVTRASNPMKAGNAWEHIKTSDGKTGYVESKYVRSPIDYRAGFMKTPDGWRMNALVAGD